MKRLISIIIFLLLIYATADAQSTFQDTTASLPSQLVDVQAYLSVEPVQIGSQIKVAVVAKIARGWHINSNRPTLDSLIPTELLVSTSEGFRAGPVVYPEERKIYLDFAGDTELSVYEDTATFGFRLDVGREVSIGTHTLPIELKYQGCSDTQCLLPASVQLEIPFEVVGLDQPVRRIHEDVFASLDIGNSSSSAQGDQIAQWIQERGYFVTFLILFILGLSLNLTPCVFPMVPITVGFFGGQSEGNTRRTFMFALFYVLGISITISILGMLAALSGGIWGSVLQNPIVILVVAGVLIALALSMFGVYEFRLPSVLMNQSGGSRAGIFGSLLMGLTMGIVAAPCIGPVILGLLLFVGQTANPVTGFWMFFVLAWGLGFPYLFLAVFSGAIHRLPQSGMWMLTVKRIFGFILLGMAIYFLESLFPEKIHSILLPGYAILAGLFIGWMDRDRIGFVFRWIKFAIAVIAISIGVWLFLSSEKAGWPLYDESSFAEAIDQGKPVILDFFADWCFSCKELEARTFADEKVQNAIHRFAAFRVDLTKSNEFSKAMESKYRIRGLPTVIFIDSTGQERHELRVEQFVSADDFLQRMQQVE